MALEIKMESFLEQVYFLNSSAGNLDSPQIFETVFVVIHDV
jgi:hypothetical protein